MVCWACTWLGKPQSQGGLAAHHSRVPHGPLIFAMNAPGTQANPCQSAYRHRVRISIGAYSSVLAVSSRLQNRLAGSVLSLTPALVALLLLQVYNFTSKTCVPRPIHVTVFPASLGIDSDSHMRVSWCV